MKKVYVIGLLSRGWPEAKENIKTSLSGISLFEKEFLTQEGAEVYLEKKNLI